MAMAAMACVLFDGAAAQGAEMPGYLKDYYAPLLEFDGHGLPLSEHKQENGGDI